MTKAPAAGPNRPRPTTTLSRRERRRTPSAGESTLVRLSCVDDDAQGQPLEVLWEREIDREIITGEAWESIAKRGFDQPKLFAAYLNTLRWNCVTSTDPRLFQSPFRAGIRLDAYQLEPLRKALRLPRVNLFIADDVGLGKTIEAGLIARELLLRKKAREIIVSLPAVDALPVEGRTGEPVRPHVRGARQRLHEADSPGARLRRQSLEHAFAVPRFPSPLDRRGIRRPAPRLAGRFPWRHAAHSGRGASRRARQRPEVCHRLAYHAGRSGTSPRGSSTGSSSPPRRTTATPTASPPCWRSSTLSASAGGCRSKRRCSTKSWSGGSRTTSARSSAAFPNVTSCRSLSTACQPTHPSCVFPPCWTSTGSSASNGSAAKPSASRPPPVC